MKLTNYLVDNLEETMTNFPGHATVIDSLKLKCLGETRKVAAICLLYTDWTAGKHSKSVSFVSS